MSNANKTKVLIVDDSPTVRMVVKSILEDDENIEIVGEASNGLEAIGMVEKLQPDVVILDLRMPEMDGLQVTEWIMANRPTPILVLTSAIDKDEKFTTFETLSRGALDIMEKPKLSTEREWEELGKLLRKKVKILKEIKVIRHVRPKIKLGSISLPRKVEKKEIVGIASSTGGPQLVREIISNLGREFPLPILIVQHITTGFDKNFAEWLQATTGNTVKIAEAAEEIEGSVVYVAPCGFHMVVDSKRRIRLLEGGPVNNHKPSADPLFESLASLFGEKAIGVILSGMGRDGARGLKLLKEKGGLALALREEECAVFGMAKAAFEEGAVDRFYSLKEIIEIIKNAV